MRAKRQDFLSPTRYACNGHDCKEFGQRHLLVPVFRAPCGAECVPGQSREVRRAVIYQMDADTAKSDGGVIAPVARDPDRDGGDSHQMER